MVVGALTEVDVGRGWVEGKNMGRAMAEQVL